MSEPHLPADASVRDLVRVALGPSVAVVAGAAAGGADSLDDVEARHRFRVATRRLRSDLRTFAEHLDPAPTDRVRDELRWLGGAVGPARDLDVLRQRLVAEVATLPADDAAAGIVLLARLDAERATARDELAAALASPRFAHLVTELVAFAGDPPPVSGSDDVPVGRASRQLVRARWRKLRRAVDRLGDDPADQDRHRVRILAKRCRYAAEAVQPVHGREAARFAEAIEAIQTLLGEHQDTVVAEAWLRTAAATSSPPSSIPTALAAGALIALERQARARVVEAWPRQWKRSSRPQLRRWLR